MRFFHLKRPRSLQNRSRLYPIYGMVALVLILCIALGMMTFLRVRDGRRSSLAQQQIRSGIQSELTLMQRTFDQMSLPRADLAGTLLPEMRMHLYSAYAFNNVLTDVYGKSESILDHALYSQIDSAIVAMDNDISAGKVIDVNASALSVCMVQLRDVMLAHFKDEDSMLPQTAIG